MSRELVLPPEIDPGNPMPLDWNDYVPRMRELYEKARTQQYNPLTTLDWLTLDPGDFSPEERLGIAYFMTTDGTFENSGVPTFARAMIASYEEHRGDDTSKMLLTIARDEMNHDEICRRVAQSMVPGFPFDFEPKTELERVAQNNQRWISYTNSKYWKGYLKAFETRRFPAITTAFILGEAAASVIFMRMSERAEHPLFKSALRLIGTDESRHFAFCNYLAIKEFGTFTDEEKATMTKNLRAAFVYISIILDVPQAPFWDVPDGFTESHLEFEAIASRGGLGVAPLDERREMWKKAALRVKALTDRFGFEFPALPEVGIEGAETPLTEEDFAVVTF